MSSFIYEILVVTFNFNNCCKISISAREYFPLQQKDSYFPQDYRFQLLLTPFGTISVA